MKEETLAQILIGIIVGIVISIVVVILDALSNPLPLSITESEITACQFAGYDTAVVENDNTLYCVNIEDLTMYTIE